MVPGIRLREAEVGRGGDPQLPRGILNQLRLDHQDPEGGNVGLDGVGMELTGLHELDAVGSLEVRPIPVSPFGWTADRKPGAHGVRRVDDGPAARAIIDREDAYAGQLVGRCELDPFGSSQRFSWSGLQYSPPRPRNYRRGLVVCQLPAIGWEPSQVAKIRGRLLTFP